MKFTLLVTSNPSVKQSANTAYEFSKAVLAKGYSISQIFFYREGTYSANSAVTLSADEINLTDYWQELASKYHIDLVVCIDSASRRGIFDNSNAECINNLASNFRLGGLAELFNAINNSDRFISF